MFTAHLIATPDQPLPYCVVIRRQGVVVRMQPVDTCGEGNRLLSRLLRQEQDYEHELQGETELEG